MLKETQQTLGKGITYNGLSSGRPVLIVQSNYDAFNNVTIWCYPEDITEAESKYVELGDVCAWHITYKTPSSC